jgi:MOSC domain-containing protein YiiM
MRVISVSAGRPALVVCNGRTYSTAINKRPARGTVELNAEGLAGDRVADDRHHGGPDQALCCYPYEHYPHWQKQLNRFLEPPAFGENLTTQGLLETGTCIGDILEVGSARVQVTQPRQPCWKLANRHHERRLPAWINALGYTGFYMRVLEPGEVCAGDELTLVERPCRSLTVWTVMQLLLNGGPETLLERCVELDLLGRSCRRQLADRLRAGNNERENPLDS